MAPCKLTKRFIDTLKPGVAEANYWDTEVKGFGLRVLPSGVMTYIIRYRINGAQRKHAIGKHGVLTPEQAREMARKLLAEVAQGKDPSGQRREAREAPTVSDLANEYMERHALPHKREASAHEDKRYLDKHILPKLAHKKVAAITQLDIENIHRGMKDTPYQGNRVRSLLSKMFSLAQEWGWRKDNPVTQVRKHQEEKREHWLQDDAMVRLMTALDSNPDQKAACALTLLVLTGARSGEVLKATWDQFDLTQARWTKPSACTKQKKVHHVTLSGAALALLAQMWAEAQAGGCTSPYLFPGRDPSKPRYDLKRPWERIQKAAGLEGTRIHDLRHTFASHLVSGGVSLAVIGKMLGHTQAATTQRYAHLADNPQREAAELIGNKFTKLGKEQQQQPTADILPFPHTTTATHTNPKRN